MISLKCVVSDAVNSCHPINRVRPGPVCSTFTRRVYAMKFSDAGLVPKKAVRFGQTRAVTLIVTRAFAPHQGERPMSRDNRLPIAALKTPPQVGDKIDIEDEAVFQGAPCTGQIVYSDGKWVTLMRGDTDECRTFGLYGLTAVAKWKRGGDTWYRLARRAGGEI